MPGELRKEDSRATAAAPADASRALAEPAAPTSSAALSGDGTRAEKTARAGRAGWRTALAVVFAIVAAPAAVLLGSRFDGGSAYLTSTAVVACAVVPFLVSFERRRPQAREVVLIAVTCAIAIASRVVFFWVPFVKPVVGVVMVAGIAFGAPSGFLVGAVTALASNFFFGQGPWTPWQMLAYGIAGLVFGLLADAGVFPRRKLAGARRVGAAIGAAVVSVAVVGPILDTSGLFLATTALTPEAAAAVYLAGLPANAVLGACSLLVVAFATNPVLAKLDRVRVKYGLME